MLFVKLFELLTTSKKKSTFFFSFFFFASLKKKKKKKRKQKGKKKKTTKRNRKMIKLFMLIVCVLLAAHCAFAADLDGDYETQCTSLAGLDPSWRIVERQVLRGDEWTAISLVYSDSNCQTLALRYDRNMKYEVGGSISSEDFSGPGYIEGTKKLVRTHWRKVVTPLSFLGTNLLNTICSATNFTTGKSVDVFEYDCAAFFHRCHPEDGDDHEEHTCIVEREEDGALIQCSRTATGSCTDEDVDYTYFPDASGGSVASMPIVPAFTDKDIAGKWFRDCSPVVGLPDGYRMSSWASYDEKGEVTMLDEWHNGEACDSSTLVLLIERRAHYTLGLEMTAVFQELSRKREFDVFYTKKELHWLKQEAADYLNSVCPENNWNEDTHRNILNVDCAPLFLSCSDWQHASIGCIGLDHTGFGLVKCVAQSIVDPNQSGCAPDDRGQYPLVTKDGDVYQLGSLNTSSAASLAVSAILLLICSLVALF
jgi:hypothetical protein